MNTAALRVLAYEARDAGDWAKAAELYQRAADVYPDGSGALRNRDIAMLERMAESCRESVAFCDAIPH